MDLNPKTQQGERLKEARKLLGLSQKDVAKALGITQANVSIIEKGSQALRREYADKLEDLFGISKYYILDGYGKPLSNKAKLPGGSDFKNGLPFVSPESLRSSAIPPPQGPEIRVFGFEDCSRVIYINSQVAAPLVCAGDYAILSEITSESLLVPGKVYAIALDSGSFVREFIKFDKGKLFFKGTDETLILPAEEVIGLFQVKGVIRRF